MSGQESAEVDRLAGLLGKHRLYGEDGDDFYECGCGIISSPEALEEDFGELLWHEVHVATVLAEHTQRTDEGLRVRAMTLADEWQTEALGLGHSAVFKARASLVNRAKQLRALATGADQ